MLRRNFPAGDAESNLSSRSQYDNAALSRAPRSTDRRHRLCLLRKRSPERSGLDPLLPIDFDSGAGPVTNGSGREHLLHRRPIRFDPPAIVAAVPVGRNSDLGELELRSATHFLDIVDGDRVMIRPPARGAPILHDLAAGLQYQIDTGNMRSPRDEFSAYLLADPGALARQRLVLFGVHQHVIDLAW